MVKRIIQTRFFYRVAESFVPFLTWMTITFPLWFSPFHPAVVSYFILTFFLYFLYKSIKTVYYAGVSYRLIKKAERVRWYRKIMKISHYEKIHHFIIITNYKEPREKLIKTIAKVTEQRYPKDHIHIVLAMEEREGEVAKERSLFLTTMFARRFANFFTTSHILQKNEIMGKASNEAWAGRFIEKKVKEMDIDFKNVLITVCDADSLLPPDYLAYLTCEYLKDKQRLFHFYWAPVLLYNNFWQLPLFIRIQAILSSVLRLSFLSQRDDLIQVSTYSTNLWLLKEVNFWDTDIIPEDWHIWLQVFFQFGEKVKTMPLYLPVSADAVLAKGLFKTYKNRYQQERRWAWGASDIPYAIKKFFETPHLNPFIKLRKIFLLVETHLFWPTSFFILTLSASIPPLINPVFKRTVMGFLLPKLSSLILTASSLLIIFILYFDYQMRKRINIKTSLINLPLLFVQWYFLPLISFLFSSLPALEAHTRMILGKKLEYKVTEKI